MRLLYAIILVVLALGLVALVLFLRPAWSTPHGLTDEETVMGRLPTVCDDGTRAVSTWHRILGCWDTIVTPLPGQTCAGPMNPRTKPWEGRCR